MANQQGNFLTAIDVGSAKTCALMAELTDTGLRYRGHGVADSRGSRKGVIVELDKAVASMFQNGGFLVAPSGTCFARLRQDERYRRAIVAADMAIAHQPFNRRHAGSPGGK